jgi:LDH2 family malate/lactate/ureidoglycolate dehydrogenase
MEDTRLSWDDATLLAGRALGRLGYTPTDAATIARYLALAEAGGQVALGLKRVAWIASILDGGAPRGDPSVVVEADGGCVVVDGHGGVGYLATSRALQLAAPIAERDGVAVAGVRDVYLTGVLRSYCEELAERGLASVIVSSAAPAFVAPGLGGRRVLGTNPLAIGVPGHPFPLLFDTSATDLPYSEVASRADRGDELPPGVALDSSGRPTVDAGEVMAGGALLGWAGHRGFGMATAVQALGMMVGAPAVPERLADCGLLAIVIDPERLNGTGAVDVGGLLTAVVGAGGSRLPGQQWHERRREARERGLDVAADTVGMLRRLADGR